MAQESHAETSGAARPTGLAAAFIGYGNFLFRYRNWVFPLAVGALFDLIYPVFAGGTLARDLWLDLLGALVVLAGQGIRAAVIGLAYIKRGGVNKRVYADNLVTEGLFAHGRNPIYVGNILMLFGYLIIHNSPWVYLLGGAFILISYRAIVAAEEDYLGRNFGTAYRDYCRDVPRWRIRLAGLGATLSGSRFNWQRVVLKDYATMMFAVIIVTGLVGYEFVVAEGWSAAVPVLIWIAAAWALAFLLGILVRVLKKTGRLRDPVKDPAP